MTEPKRIVDDDDAGPQRQVLRSMLEGRAGETYTPSEAKWRALGAEGSMRPSPAWRGVTLAIVGTAALAAVTFVLLRPLAEPAVAHLGTAVAAVDNEPVSAERRGEEILLHQGKLAGLPSTTLNRILTPHLSVAWKAARFLAFVTGERTMLSVEEGYVVARQGEAERLVSKGEQLIASAGTLSAGGRELVPGALKQMPPLQAERCQQGLSESELTRCLGDVAAGSDLAAQNALFELALRGRGLEGDPAIARWQEYLRRFPDGALAPEAQVGITIELCSSGRLPEALQETQAYLSRWGDEPSSREMIELRQRLQSWLAPPREKNR